jgi:adenylate cyclase
MGDGALVEFASVVDAVESALAIQRILVEGDGPFTLRIGINLGDVIIDGDDIYGDGVNIAARLEKLAEPGGICLSSVVFESLGNRVDAVFADAGEHAVKNIDKPIRVWKWPDRSAAATGVDPAPSIEANAPVLPEKPSIAVLPLNNMSNDPDQDFLADGIAEDIITSLSKFGSLFVIARNSSFSFKGQQLEVKKIGKRSRKSASAWVCATCSKAASGEPATARALPPSLLMPSKTSTSGRNVMTAISKTYLPSRMK